MYKIRRTTNIVDTAALNAEKQRLRDSIVALERLNARRVQDSIDNARRYNAIKQTIAQVQEEEREKLVEQEKELEKEEEKKRKKKFFDIRFEKRD